MSRLGAIAADQKISVITAIQTLICGFLFDQLRDWIDGPSTSRAITVALFIGSGLLASGIAFCVSGLFPRVDPPAGKSVTFFGSIQTWTLPQYRDLLAGMNEEAWKNDYLAQIHTNAAITMKKHAAIKNSVTAFSMGLLVIALCYCAALAGF